ncbi:formin-binding protein 4 isoform X1 [Syngnathus acus]|uniref:formin-binding protein 4 isoform X1 n=1 Tax=Syngnathus acus TaxID=161584 RepID=UPI0018862435|nr:formin-binding protein 4 isoform X1 [Syngnathus acus]
MKKKTRSAGGAVGRRTILQLSPSGLRGGNAGEREDGLSGSDAEEQEGEGQRILRARLNMKPPAVKATEGLSLLGAYEDSDEEDAAVSRSTATSQHNHSADIDSTLANFMAEIDAITTQPSSDDAAGQPSIPTGSAPKPDANAQQPGAKPDQLEFNTQYSLAGVDVEMGDWQEVWDDNSGCYYYWNTQNNEVSWELPHDLANQVQRLAHYTNSANGNGTSSADHYPGETTPAAPPTSAKETKVKASEVMESVVALTSKEEERCGVAASLLGPLIPTEVKDAEEKWRKKLLNVLDENETSVDSDGEVVRPVASPSTPSHDLAAIQTVEKDSDAKKLSEENSEIEGGPEEDTMELELALERKKAELQALEDGDGSAGGSSPCSETSQDASVSRGALRKKRWKTVFPGAPSPDSNSRSSEPQENIQTAYTKVPESVTAEEDGETGNPEQKPEVPPKEEVETPELRFQIGELANTLTSKMEFLGIHKKAVSNFQLLLLQTETRIADWREGALNGAYLRSRLQEAAEHIKHYELNAAPKGWSCHWDREHRRYFYVNDLTHASQWEFPTEEAKGDALKGNQTSPTTSQGDGKTSSVPPVRAPAVPPAAPSSSWSPSQPPLPDSPPPPPDLPPLPPLPPGSPPPPPPPPDSDSEIMEVEMEMDDDNDMEPPAPGTEEDGSGWPPSAVAGVKVLESSDPLGKGQKRKAGQLNKAIIGSSPILYTQHVTTAAPVITAPVYWGVPAVTAPLVPSEPPLPLAPAMPPQPPLPPPQPACETSSPKVTPVEKIKKTKKDKKGKTKMPSLVKKWQSIQKELEEEEKSSSSDEDRDQLNKKSIEDWKHQQLLTGKASKNANFEALPDNWRDRLKKRKLNST